MDYYLFIWSVVTFVEKRLKTDIEYTELEAATGFSYRHIRETFRECTKTSLAKYILNIEIERQPRKVAFISIELLLYESYSQNIV